MHSELVLIRIHSWIKIMENNVIWPFTKSYWDFSIFWMYERRRSLRVALVTNVLDYAALVTSRDHVLRPDCPQPWMFDTVVNHRLCLE